LGFLNQKIYSVYGTDGKPLRQKYYYQIEVNSTGKLDVTKMMPINNAEVAPNTEKPQKKNL
jgi:hypothetical protein